ncbi:hypothetical protein, unlikely [Trypanosoma brucei gambiense DAL972]|uniref:Uncharacterized protein n=1 Tax=Trypanosoma brucei gambiense (strain MHOM/CI/86/DAL972) TaxID=679716 RepID=C9ZNQ0_TRYB9|nr:hypothetical protein, unlikely [Trypanosoma brucei gambiense DAL972]CBH11028.1 hypothetical protein, unlikely [Trypanosoma brucei gambiense DAL972]|eukprot:XP_011773315.1 hypothetical protein, unlikely [Trypanosoma brucei gambiense DAL972]
MFCSTCVSLVGVISALMLLSYLGFVIIYVPVYRYLAITVLLLLLSYRLSVWRFLPTERAHVRRLAEKIVERRRAYALPTSEEPRSDVGANALYVPAAPYL